MKYSSLHLWLQRLQLNLCVYKPLCDDSEKVSQVFTLSQDKLRCLWMRKGESVVKIWIGLLLKLTSYEHNYALECSPSNLEVC